jgi:filamentous hemagglutinin family protein
MTESAHFFDFRARLVFVMLLALGLSSRVVRANPQGASVGAGTATFHAQGAQLTIQTSAFASINWQSFNIGVGETTTFQQPSSSSVVFNQINDQNPTQILGSLNANGYVFLENAAGFYVGGQASIHAGGLVMTTAPLPPPDLAEAGAWSFNSPPPTAKIINYGQINLGSGGSAFLIADDVENHGSINALGGNIGLYAGQQVLVSERPDGRGLSASVTLPRGSVSNDGKLIADAGAIALNAQVVNQGGLIQADSVRDVNGTIELVAGDAVNLGPNSVLSAQGDSQGASPGGNVSVQSGGTFTDAAGSLINVSGGAQGGNGGQVEVSAPAMTGLQSQIQGGASPGWVGGSLTIDPQNITLVASGGDGVSTFNVSSYSGMSQIDLQASQNITVATPWTLAASASPNATLTLQAGNNITINSGDGITAGQNWTVNLVAGANFTTLTGVTPGAGAIALNGQNPLQGVNGPINLFSGGNISINAPWILTGINVPETLSLQAGNNISFTSTGSLALGEDWSANFQAGLNFSPSSVISANNGGVYLTTGQGSYIASLNGNIDIQAFNEVLVGTGAIGTYGGGNILVDALKGNVNTGTSTLGYTFNGQTGYSLVPYTLGGLIQLGGISTQAGGNVSITAGQNVISLLPPIRSGADGGSGAFGPEPGIVTVQAGGNVTGHYVAANSTQNGALVASTITAGGNAGTPGSLLALSLVKGGWVVNAPNGNINLQEVRNPNGTLNSKLGPEEHQFDYDPLSFLDLNAGNQIQLGSGAAFNSTTVPVILPPSVTINAGTGGIQLDANITLFPSPDGELNVTTTGGGSLYALQSSSNPQQEAGINWQLNMSDSGSTRWISSTSFTSQDHASVPIQFDNPDPVVLNISGNLSDLFLSFPKAADITVAGNWLNTEFQGQNLRSGDVTSITVAGQLLFRPQATYYQLAQPLPAYENSDSLIATLLQNAYDANGNKLAINGDLFSYNPDTLQVSVSKKLLPADYTMLSEIAQEQEFINGVPQFTFNPANPLNPEQPVLVPVTFLTPAALSALYANSQNVPASFPNTGLQLAGPGSFKITAASVTLPDNGAGIDTSGAALNTALAPLGSSGANIDLTTTSGNLTMNGSFISTYSGGGIDVNSAGSVEVGSAEDFGFANTTTPRGIYVEGAGNLSVTANGNIDVAGSRIETFGGGDIALLSENGNIDAGNGAAGTFTPNIYETEPGSGRVIEFQPTFSGSGIEALTLPTTLVAEDQVTKQVVTLNFGSATVPGNISLATPRGNIVASEGGILQEPLNGNASAGPTVQLTAGSRDSQGHVTFAGNIDVSGSGVIGEAVNASATGTINGLLIGSQSVSITTPQAFSGTVVSAGSATISASSVSGNIVAVSGISIGEGTVVNANLLSQNVNVGGSAGPALASTATASATAQSASQDSTAQAKAATGLEPSDDTGDDPLKRGKGKGGIKLGRTSRVTVIL